MKRIAVVQSSYVPWKGYFDLIAAVDEFVLYDDVQYTRRDWRNRNRIKTPQGIQWLTVPVKVKGSFAQRINQVEIDGNRWADKHWKTIAQNYGRAAYYDEVAELIRPFYYPGRYAYLTELNCDLIVAICRYLGVATLIRDSREFRFGEGKNRRLVDICSQANASVYLSGPSAQNYIDESVFREAGIDIEFMDYSGYPEYPQLYGAFEHKVSIIDLLFNVGERAMAYMKFGQQA